MLRRFACSSWSYGEGAQIGVYTAAPPAWFECFSNIYTNSYWTWSALYLQNLSVCFCMFWIVTLIHCFSSDSVYAASANQIPWYLAVHSSLFGNIQPRQRYRTWGSIRESDLAWQECSLLDFCGDRLWQCSEYTGKNQLFAFYKANSLEKFKPKGLLNC